MTQIRLYSLFTVPIVEQEYLFDNNKTSSVQGVLLSSESDTNSYCLNKTKVLKNYRYIAELYLFVTIIKGNP